jgi:hypothetical protein
MSLDKKMSEIDKLCKKTHEIQLEDDDTQYNNRFCIEDEDTNKELLVNKGTGAGGANTTHNGLAFERKVANEDRLLSSGFVHKYIGKKHKNKYSYYLEKITAKQTIHFVKQNGLVEYMLCFHKKIVDRHPDAAYIFIDNITGDITVKILEIKNQNRSGSVEDKLCLGSHFIEEYSSYFNHEFKVEYAFCVSSFLKTRYNSDRRWSHIRPIMIKHNISVLFGGDDDYFSKLDEWLNL